MVKYLCLISFIPASSFAFYSCIIICFFVRILFSAVVWAAVVAKLVTLGISSTVNSKDNSKPDYFFKTKFWGHKNPNQAKTN